MVWGATGICPVVASLVLKFGVDISVKLQYLTIFLQHQGFNSPGLLLGLSVTGEKAAKLSAFIFCCSFCSTP